MFANNQKTGKHIITVPDVCKTPPNSIPIPYPNMGSNSSGKKSCSKVLFCKSPAHNVATFLKSTTMNEVGKIGGIVSNTTRGKSEYTMGSTKVFTKKKPTTKLGSITTQNSKNTMGSQKVPCQTKVMIGG